MPQRVAKLLGRGLVLLIAAAFALGTIDRNREYRSSLTLAQTTVDRYPTSVGRYVLAVQLLLNGRKDDALVQLRLALPGAPRAHYTLGVVLFHDSRWQEAVEQLQLFVEKQPHLLQAVDARLLMAQAFTKLERWNDAITQDQRVLGMNPSTPQRVEALSNAAIAFIATNRMALALPLFEQAARIDPSNPVVQQNLANARVDARASGPR